MHIFAIYILYGSYFSKSGPKALYLTHYKLTKASGNNDDFEGDWSSVANRPRETVKENPSCSPILYTLASMRSCTNALSAEKQVFLRRFQNNFRPSKAVRNGGDIPNIVYWELVRQGLLGPLLAEIEAKQGRGVEWMWRNGGRKAVGGGGEEVIKGVPTL
ncbi:hypothetical protein BJ165DRAFT_1408625 [Panaeolus papilionaceus]|nr:hypothetical protein BJ165DRAFT_1408625 [Panaeolus papilionaceus]